MSNDLKIGQLIPDAIYRIRSALKSDHYLDHQSASGQDDVRPLVSNPTADTQQWQIKGNTGSGAANTYTVTNVGSKLNLAFRDDTDSNGNPIRRLSAASSARQWTIEPRGDSFVIGWEGNEQAVDYADAGADDWAILWDRNDGTQQRWVLERVNTGPVVSPQAGQIKFVNNSINDVMAHASNWSKTPGYNDTYVTVKAGQSYSWPRVGTENVTVIGAPYTGEPGGGLSVGMFVRSATVVTFTGYVRPGLALQQ